MSDERSVAAADRRNAAQTRSEELHRLRERLEAGVPVDVEDLVLAHRRLEQARAFAGSAHGRAAEAHRRAAETHRQAAEVAEAAGERLLANRHRQAAADEDRAAAAAASGRLRGGADESA